MSASMTLPAAARMLTPRYQSNNCSNKRRLCYSLSHDDYVAATKWRHQRNGGRRRQMAAKNSISISYRKASSAMT